MPIILVFISLLEQHVLSYIDMIRTAGFSQRILTLSQPLLARCRRREVQFYSILTFRYVEYS